VFQLPGRMRVQRLTHLIDHPLDLGLVCGRESRLNGVKMLGLEHATLGKGELKHRVVNGVIPIDQLLNNVVVDPEWQNGCNHFHLMSELGWKSLQLRNLRQMTGGVNLERGGDIGFGSLD